MKKLLLSAATVLAFVLYAVFQRGSQAPNISLAQTTGSAVSQGQTTSTSAPVGSSAASSVTSAAYKDGSYTGSPANAFYGTVQVKAVVQGGKLTDVQFLNYPRDRRTSLQINSQATPALAQEAIQSQSANVQVVTGATFTSQAFMQSLNSALTQAKA